MAQAPGAPTQPPPEPSATAEEPPVVLSPTTGYRELGPGEIDLLRQVGRRWHAALGSRARWLRALPVDPDLGGYRETLSADRRARFVPVEVAGPAGGEVEATKAAAQGPTAFGRAAAAFRRAVIGPALSSSAVVEERMRKLVALPVLSSDALSSVAYGPEAMLVVLVLGGHAALGYSVPIAAAITVLMIVVGLSYRQTIKAYPRGGGSYIVASDNLGLVPGLTAAAGLMLDYVLTVSVSVASGVAAATSAIPSLAADAVPLGLGVIALLVAGNLRGVRQAGALFAAPTYMFIVAIFLMVIVGLIDAAGKGFTATPQPPVHATGAVSLVLVLRAFSSGATAMTGLEAISDGIPAFQPVEWRNARTTLTVMVTLLVLMFVGTIVLVELDGVVPASSQTVLSQLAHIHLGNGIFYAYVQASTALVLLLAANTAFSDFPRLLFFLARDYSAPRLFLRMGDRLAFSNGIIVLGVASAIILVAFNGSVDALIPLFAVGVFLAFTLSQTGMVLHWWRGRQPGWRGSIGFNALGALLSGIVLLITGTSKFAAGAWIVVVLVPLLVALALRIRAHYLAVGRAIALHPIATQARGATIVPVSSAPAAGPRASGRAPLDGDAGGRVEREESPDEIRHLTVVPIVSMDLASLRALAYATSLGQPVLALHLSPEEDEARRFRAAWDAWGDHLPLEVIVSPYRALVAPMARYLTALHDQTPNVMLTVILPELIVRRRWHQLLHNQIAPRLRRALRPLPGVVVTTVPFHLPA